MKMKDYIADLLLIGMSVVLLLQLSYIWLYGQHLIQEPNILILSSETAAVLLILVFGIRRSISDLKRKRGIQTKVNKTIGRT